MDLKVLERRVEGLGMVYLPAGDGPFPGIVLLHGSEGGWSGLSHRDAVMFAAHGFAACPFAYSRSGNIWNAGDIVDVPLDATVQALDQLRGQPFSAGKVGLFGASRGGEHALLLAWLMTRDGLTPPDATAVHAAADVVCGGFRAACCRGEGRETWDPASRAWTWRGSSEELLPTVPIEIERYDGPLFLSCGAKDEVWSPEMTRRLQNRLLAAGRRPEVHLYPEQGHGFGDDDAGNRNMARLIDFFRRSLR